MRGDVGGNPESLLHHCPTAIVRLDRDGTHVYANPAAAELLGRPVEDIVGKRFGELGFGPAMAELWEQRLADVFRAGEPVEYRDAIGPDKTLVLRWVPERASDGAVAAVLAYAHVVEQRQAAPRHVSREALAIKIASLGIWDWDIATDRTVWNDEMLRIYGVRRDDFTGRGADYIAFTREDYREPQRTFIAQSFETGVTEAEALARDVTFSPHELCIVAADGHERFTIGDAIAIVDDNRRPVRLLGVTLDVTEQRRAERARHELEERFVKAFRFNPGAMSIAELDGRLIEVNERFAALMGFSAEQLSGHQVSELGIVAEPADRDDLVARIAANRAIHDMPLKLRLPTGTVREVLLSVDFITLGGRRCILSFLSDVTELNRMQEQLMQAQKLEAIGQLAGGVAHDFNNLLTIVNAGAELALRRTPRDDPRREELDSILAAGQRGAELTRKLLAFGRRQLLDPRVLDLGELVRELVPLLRRVIGEHIELAVAVGDAPALVKADHGQIEQVVMNLVVNACDAMPDGGRLEIAVATDATTEPPSVTLAVTDTGTGIPADVRPRIFEPFFTTKPVGKGTGLGLSTAHGIVKQSGGTIAVDSRVGGGTRFTIALPGSREPVDADVPREDAPVAPASATILLVEDDAAVRKVTARALAQMGFRVVEADSAPGAIAAFEAGAPIDLVLTDVVLPGASGKRLVEQLRSRAPRLRVLFMSGYPEGALAQGGVLPAGTELIAKPFTPDELQRRVRAILADR